MLARHEQFTLFAAAALSYGADDWVSELIALLPDLSSGGATELSELLLHSKDERVYSFLLRRSLAIGHALNLGVGWLCEALDSGDVDDDLRRGARSILDALTWSFSEPEALPDHPGTGIAVERFLELLTDRDFDARRTDHGVRARRLYQVDRGRRRLGQTGTETERGDRHPA